MLQVFACMCAHSQNLPFLKMNSFNLELCCLKFWCRSLCCESLKIAEQLGKYQSERLFVAVNDKGWGVFMKKLIWKGEVVCEYEGDLVPHAEGRKWNVTETCFFVFFF